MASTKRKLNKGFIVLNKGERIAVISLLSMIVILLGFSIFRPMINLSKKDTLAFHRLDSLLAVQDALLQQQEQREQQLAEQQQAERHPAEQKAKTTDTKAYSSNKTPCQTTIHHEDSKTKAALAPIDLNQADSTELLALPQIGTTMASRIHRYRQRLGGFVSMQQLFEIKGMDTARFETIKPYIIINSDELQTINVNQDEFKTLLRHPYLEYDQVKAIVNHRERKGLITNWKQLTGIVGEVNPLLENYLKY